MTWIVVVIITIVVIIIFRFISDLNKDNYDLQGGSLAEKFSMVVLTINDAAFSGGGRIIPINKRQFNLYEEGQNQIVCFGYSTGHLTIIWKYKYYQKEVSYEKIFRNVRNLSLSEQQRIANVMIDEMNLVIAKHQNNVLGGFK